MAQHIMEGARFAQLQSELTVLRRRQRRLGKRFWSEASSPARLGRLEAIEKRCSDVRADIQSLSTDLLLAEMDGEVLTEQYAESLEVYREGAREAWIGLYEALVEGGDVVTVGIYGPEAECEAYIEIYTSFAEAQGFRHGAWHLWLRAEGKEATFVAQGEQEVAPAGEVRWVGRELEIRGPGVGPLFDQEAGIHAWEDKAQAQDSGGRRRVSLTATTRRTLGPRISIARQP